MIRPHADKLAPTFYFNIDNLHISIRLWFHYQTLYLFVFEPHTFVNCGHLKNFLLLPDLKIW